MSEKATEFANLVADLVLAKLTGPKSIVPLGTITPQLVLELCYHRGSLAVIFLMTCKTYREMFKTCFIINYTAWIAIKCRVVDYDGWAKYLTKLRRHWENPFGVIHEIAEYRLWDLDDKIGKIFSPRAIPIGYTVEFGNGVIVKGDKDEPHDGGTVRNEIAAEYVNMVWPNGFF